MNEELEGRLVLLKSAEVEILEDGSLELPERLLRRLDLTICSLHQRFDLPERRQTEPFRLDLERVIETSGQRGRFLELDAA